MYPFLLRAALLLAILLCGQLKYSAAQAPIFYDDFSNPANWVMGHTAGTTGDWYLTSSNVTFIGALNSTSGGDFAAFNSDAQGQGTTNDAWIQTANPINCSGYFGLVLSFEQTYMRFMDNVYVEFSTDAISWTPVQVNSQYSTNQISANPELITIDISAYANNQPTFYVRFRYQGAWDYAWAVDDVTIRPSPYNDLSLDTLSFNGAVDNFELSYYSNIPQLHAERDTLELAARISNQGTALQPNTRLEAIVSGPVAYNSFSPGVMLAPATQDTFVAAAPHFVPSLQGGYTVTVEALSDSVDQVPQNNTQTYSFTVTDTVYARDFGPYSGGFSYQPGQVTHQLGVKYKLSAPDTITSIGINLYHNNGFGTNVGAQLNMVVYDINFTPLVSIPTTVDASWFAQWKTVPLPTPLAVTPGEYIVGYQTVNDSDNVWIASGTPPATLSENAVFVNIDSAGWGYMTTNLPFIRMHVRGVEPDTCAWLTATEAVTPVFCAGDTTGAIFMTPGGGTAPYNWIWSDGDTASNRTGLTAGNYYFTLTDANSCVRSDSVLITETPTMVALTSTTSEFCGNMNGTATIDSIYGGSGLYNIMWQDSTTDSTLTGLGTGYHSFTITDLIGCTFTDSVLVPTSSPVIMLSLAATNVACNGNEGTVTSTGSGGTMPYTYNWSNGSMAASQTGLAQGTYTLTFTDASGCPTVDSVMVGANPFPNMTVSMTTTDAGCGLSNGQAAITAMGGDGQYTYQWTSGSTNASITVASGWYLVTVSDSAGCVVLDTAYVDENGIALTPTVVDATCFGDNNGAASVQANNGTAPFSFSWSNGNSGQLISNLMAGTYTVTTTDNNGCTGIDSVIIGQASQLQLTLAATDEFCADADGTVLANVSGATGNPNFDWSHSTSLAGALAVNLASGSYTVTVTDSIGCTQTASVNVANNNQLSIAINSVDANCAGESSGSASVFASGAQSPYSYAWNAPGNPTSALVNNLPEGTWTVVVTDAGTCQATDSVVIGATFQPPTVSLGPDTIVCAGSTVSVQVPSGFSSVLWSVGGAGNQVDFSVTEPMDVWVQVTSTDGCVASDTVAIDTVFCVGIDELLAGNRIAVQPNPSNGQFAVTTNTAFAGTPTVRIFDAFGRLVLVKSLSAGNVRWEMQTDLPAGMYLLQLHTNEGIAIKRLVVK